MITAGLGALLFLAAVVLAAGVAWLNSDNGRDWLVGEIAARHQAGEIPFQIGEIRGNPLGELEARGFELTDDDGVWLTAPVLRLSWRPLALLAGRVDITSLSAPDAVWLRRPAYANGGEESASSGGIESYRLGSSELGVSVRWLEGDPVFVLTANGQYRPRDITELHAELTSEAPAADRARIDLNWNNTGRNFDIAIEAFGPEDGALVELAGLAGRGDLAVTAAGSGPLNAWNGKIDASLGRDYGLSLLAEAESQTSVAISGTGGYPAFTDPVLDRIFGRQAALRGRISAAEGNLTTVNLELSPPGGRLSVSFALEDGTSIATDGIGVEAALNPMEWAGLTDPAPRTGAAAFSGTLTGKARDFVLEGRLDVADIASGIADAESVMADLMLERAEDRLNWRISASGAGLSWHGNLGDLPQSESFNSNVSGTYGLVDKAASLDIDDFDVGWVGGSARYSRSAGEEEETAALSAQVRLPGLLRRQDLLSEGRANIDLNVMKPGRGNPWSGTLSLKGSGLASSQPQIASLIGTEPGLDVEFASVDFRLIDVSTGELSARAGMLDFDGLIGGEELSLTYRASLTNLADQLPENLSFEGALDVAGTVSGSPSEPVTSGAFSVDRIDIAGFLVTNAATELNFAAPFDRWSAQVQSSGDSQYGPVTVALSAARQTDGGISIADLTLAVSTLNVTGALNSSAAGGWQGTIRGSLQPDPSQDATPLIDGAGDFSLELLPGDGGSRLAVDANLVGLEFVAPNGVLTNIGAIGGRLVAQNRAPYVAEGTNLIVRDLSHRNLFLEEARLTADGGAPESGALAAVGSYLEAFDVDIRFQGAPATDSDTAYDISLDGRFADHPIESQLRLNVSQGVVQAEIPSLRFGEGQLTALASFQNGSVSASAQLTEIDLAIIPPTQFAAFRGGQLSGSLEFALGESAETAAWDLTLSDLESVGPLGTAEARFRLESNGRILDRSVAIHAAAFAGSERAGALEADFRYRRLGDGAFEIDADAPVAATLDWAGDIAPLWTLARLPDHALDGRLEGGLQVSGTLNAPRFDGSAQLRDGAYSFYPTGLRLEDISAEIAGSGDQLSITELSGSDGSGGRLSASGNVQISPALTFPGTVQIEASRLQLLRRDDIRGNVSANLTYERGADFARVNGDLTAHQVDAELVRRLPRSIVDIEYRTLDGGEQTESPEETAARRGRMRAELDIDGNFPGQVFVRGRGLDTEWQGRLRLHGTTAEPRISGELDLRRGTFDLVGRRFDIREGRLTFLGGRRIDPEINIRAEAATPNIRALVLITGRTSAPVIEISSSPPLPEDEVIARLLFGTSVTELSAFQVAEVAAAISTLRGNGGLDIMGRARRTLGLDTFYVAPTGEGENGYTVTGGKYLRRNVFVEVQQKTAVSDNETRIRIDFANRFRAESTFGPERGNGFKLKLFWDY